METRTLPFINKFGQYYVKRTLLKNGYTYSGLIAFDFNDIALGRKIVLDSKEKMVSDIESLCPQPFKSMLKNTTATIEQKRQDANDVEYTFRTGTNIYSERFLKIFFSAFCYAVLPFEDNMTAYLNFELKTDLRMIVPPILNKSLDQHMESLCNQFGLEDDYQKYRLQFPIQNTAPEKTNLIQAVYGVDINVSDDALMKAAAEKIRVLQSHLDRDQTNQLTLYPKGPK